MDLMTFAIILSALLSSLVAGFVLCFAIVVMPGIRAMGNFEFLKSFKAMDSVIQNGQPVFMLVWIGSALVLLASTILGMWQLSGLDQYLLIIACVMYIFGVHVPTITINIPLNNRLQAMDLDSATESELLATAELFETRWSYWNTARTVIAVATSVVLFVLLVRL